MANSPNIKPANTAPRERLVPNPKARLQDQLHEVCRFRHLSARTEEAYWGWVRRFSSRVRVQRPFPTPVFIPLQHPSLRVHVHAPLPASSPRSSLPPSRRSLSPFWILPWLHGSCLPFMVSSSASASTHRLQHQHQRHASGISANLDNNVSINVTPPASEPPSPSS